MSKRPKYFSCNIAQHCRGIAQSLFTYLLAHSVAKTTFFGENSLDMPNVRFMKFWDNTRKSMSLHVEPSICHKK